MFCCGVFLNKAKGNQILLQNNFADHIITKITVILYIISSFHTKFHLIKYLISTSPAVQVHHDTFGTTKGDISDLFTQQHHKGIVSLQALYKSQVRWCVNKAFVTLPKIPSHIRENTSSQSCAQPARQPGGGFRAVKNKSLIVIYWAACLEAMWLASHEERERGGGWQRPVSVCAYGQSAFSTAATAP